MSCATCSRPAQVWLLARNCKSLHVAAVPACEVITLRLRPGNPSLSSPFAPFLDSGDYRKMVDTHLQNTALGIVVAFPILGGITVLLRLWSRRLSRSALTSGMHGSFFLSDRQTTNESP